MLRKFVCIENLSLFNSLNSQKLELRQSDLKRPSSFERLGIQTLAFGLVLVVAACASSASALFAYRFFALSSHGGDFSFILAFLPAAIAFALSGGVVVAAGVATVLAGRG